MATVQSELGKIVLFEDFGGHEVPVALTATTQQFGDFRVIGDGLAEADSGIINNESDPNLNGVGLMSTTDEDKHCIGLATPIMFDVGLMAPIVLEARFQHDDLDTKGFFMGLSDVNADDLSLEDDLIHGATATLTLTASDLVGFYWSSELTDDEDLHAVYNGGATTGDTVSDNVDLGTDLAAAVFKIIRLEVDPNGTARWYVDGVLKKTVEGAVSTSVDLAAMLVVEDKNNTAAVETMSVDYFRVTANRDWTT